MARLILPVLFAGKRVRPGGADAAPPAPTFRQHGFTLTELAVVMVIVALLIGGMMVPMVAQYDVRDRAETQTILKSVEEALLGFYAANDRLPCPATATSNGRESGSAITGLCDDFTGGFLPAANLGFAPIDAQGFAIDAWGNRIRYAVFGGTINTVDNPFTRHGGIKLATLSAFYGQKLLVVCPSATGVTSDSCGSNPFLTESAPVVFFSTGKNGATGGHGLDENENLGTNARIFVSHDPTPGGATNGEFDDIVRWISPNVMLKIASNKEL